MRLCHRAGHAVPLLTLCAVLAGCATSTTEPPANFNSNPQVVAIYAVDSAFGSLPDVLIFSSASGDTGKVSTSPPPSYGSYRVEFDQPVAGETVANGTDRADTTPGTAASFCSPLGTSPIQLLDVQGDTGRPANTPVVTSVCYDATSALGSHPHVLVIPGGTTNVDANGDPVDENSLTNPAVKPLTCNTFVAAGPVITNNGRDVFKPNHKYGIQVKSGVVQNRAGKALSAPTLGGWVGDTFQFTTSGFKILAAGFQDPNTGFFVWLDKPEPGFEKDLAPIAATYEQPSDSGPFLVVVSEPVATTTGITLVRDDTKTAPAPRIGTRGALIGDRRVIEIRTGDTYEADQTYDVTIPASLTADSKDVISGAKTYTFKATTGDPSIVSVTPANGAQAQAVGTAPIIEFSAPVDVTAGVPTGATFTLAGGPGGNVPVTASVSATRNNQLVTLTPGAALIPETTYQLTASGAKVGPEPKVHAGQAFPASSTQFTTATFRMGILHDPNEDAALGATNVNLDRRTDVEPVDLKNGNLEVTFNGTAAGVSPSTVVVSELNGTANTPTPLSGYSVVAGNAPTSTLANSFVIKLPATYQPKFGQKYEVRALTTITNPTSGKALKAEGCNTADCSDVKSFTTRKVSAAIGADPSPDAATGFTVSFSDPMDPATIDLTSQFKLFPRDATGALGTTPVPLTCTITDGPGSAPPGAAANPTVVSCSPKPPATLGSAPNAFLASAVFLQTAPAKVSSAVSTDASAQFFGAVSSNILAPCPATP